VPELDRLLQADDPGRAMLVEMREQCGQGVDLAASRVAGQQDQAGGLGKHLLHQSTREAQVLQTGDVRAQSPDRGCGFAPFAVQVEAEAGAGRRVAQVDLLAALQALAMGAGQDGGQQVPAVAAGDPMLADGNQLRVDPQKRRASNVQMKQGGPMLDHQVQQLGQRVGDFRGFIGSLVQALQDLRQALQDSLQTQLCHLLFPFVVGWALDLELQGLGASKFFFLGALDRRDGLIHLDGQQGSDRFHFLGVGCVPDADRPLVDLLQGHADGPGGIPFIKEGMSVIDLASTLHGQCDQLELVINLFQKVVQARVDEHCVPPAFV
jgi:hypothetical protein